MKSPSIFDLSRDDLIDKLFGPLNSSINKSPLPQLQRQ